MQNEQFDISVIVTAHHEGRLAHHTMKSLMKAIGVAKEHSVKTEIIIVLDNPDAETEEYFSRYNGSGRVVHRVDFGDPGLSRNHGGRLSSGRYVAFLDADDLFGKNWLRAAYDAAEKMDGYCVLHPEYSVCFEREDLIAKHLGIYDNAFCLKNLLEYNYWSVFCFTRREVLTETPFIRASLDDGFGYEDWHWCCEVLSKGIPIMTVPETCVFVRRKLEGSRLSGHNRYKTMIPPSGLFEPATFSRMLQEEEKRKLEQRDVHGRGL
jgi:glycosyltransferase involved in cell wall biosynthesis